MNPVNTTLIPPICSRLVLGIFSILAAFSVAASAATQAQQVRVNLKGKQFGHALSLKATNPDWLIAPSKLYHYKISGSIRGKGGALGVAFPNSVPLDKFMNSIKTESASVLQGSFENPTGNLPSSSVTLVNKSIKGTRTINGIGAVNLEMKLTAKLSYKGQITIQLTGVKITSNGTNVSGVIVFEQGSQLEVTTSPIVEFKALGQAAFEEDAGNATVTVWRLGNKNATASVRFATSNGTAIAGKDYTSTTGEVFFARGESTKTISVPILNNIVKDGYRKFTITLSNPASGTVLGTKHTNTVAINNND